MCRMAGAPVMPRTARPRPMGGRGVLSNNLPSYLSHSDEWDNFSSQGGAWVARDLPRQVFGTTLNKPLLLPERSFPRSRFGLASSRAMQCSRVEQESRSSRRLEYTLCARRGGGGFLLFAN